MLNIKHTIEKTKYYKVSNTQHDGQTLDSGDLDGNENACGEHDSSNTKAIGIAQIFKIAEGRNDYDGPNHKYPVKSRDVNLTLDRL